MSIDVIGSGWRYPLGFTAGGGVDLAHGNRRLEQSMRLILTTYPGERRMLPEFGSRLRDYVFAPLSLDTATELSAEVRRALERWEPRVTITDVVTLPDADDPTLLSVDIAYTVEETGDRHRLVFPFHLDGEGR
ncbi:GPW/gp25 family protein [Amycolatopsis sp. NPDC049252]|uniref:GPW/gp25 family protein n=1 Tax=Amycolatopsis sp. NPDC049252 TaxID=3363933 RepID=UPI003722B2A9